MNFRLAPLTTAQKLHLAAFVGYFADFLLVYSNKVAPLPFLPDWLSYLWGLLLVAALIVHALGGFLGLPPADPALNAQAQVVVDQVASAGALPTPPAVARLTPELSKIEALAAQGFAAAVK